MFCHGRKVGKHLPGSLATKEEGVAAMQLKMLDLGSGSRFGARFRQLCSFSIPLLGLWVMGSGCFGSLMENGDENPCRHACVDSPMPGDESFCVRLHDGSAAVKHVLEAGAPALKFLWSCCLNLNPYHPDKEHLRLVGRCSVVGWAVLKNVLKAGQC